MTKEEKDLRTKMDDVVSFYPGTEEQEEQLDDILADYHARDYFCKKNHAERLSMSERLKVLTKLYDLVEDWTSQPGRGYKLRVKNLIIKYKNFLLKEYESTAAIIESYENYIRYAEPWVWADIGFYTGVGKFGESGDLVVLNPVKGHIYEYWPMDPLWKWQNKHGYKIWDGENFIPCDEHGKTL